jgi:aminoglycoside phosphotransferase (APT) family kinase protein
MTEDDAIDHDHELTAVRDAHRFDEAALATYLSAHLDGCGDDMAVRQFEGGQSNPTFMVESGDRRWVVRKKPPGELLPSAHAVDREYRVMAALAGTGVPVPETYLLCEDETIIGTAFFVMEMVPGRVIADIALPGFSAAERTALYDHFIEVLAALHSVDYEVVGLSEFGRVGNYVARQISRWSKQYVASKTEDIPEMDALMEWLPENLPETDETTVVHGDYRIGNCVLHPTEPRIVAVLDWELSTLGHPLGDLSYICQAYHAESVTGDSLVGIDHDATGIPSEQHLLDLYCSLTGRDGIENWTYYIAYNLFRSAAIIQGVYKRGLDGISSSERSTQYADACRSRAEWAWKLAQQANA